MNRDQQSIFGPTYDGVPNPVIPHVHPYPTRYHGPIWTYPEAGLPYVATPYARAPYAGLGGCACKGLAGSPDGLGDPVLCASTGMPLLDAAIGAAIGVIAAPKPSDQALWALIGAGSAWLGGVVGMIGVGAAGLYMRNK